MTEVGPSPRLGEDDLRAVDALVAPADALLAGAYPGDPGTRQPVHTAYVPADRVTDDLCPRWGREARAALDEHAPDPAALAGATGLPVEQVEAVWPRLLDKLAREPVEDLRVDLEDGYGPRPDAEEDADVVAAMRVVGRAAEAGHAPPYVGLRVKCLEAPTRRRGLRTLDLAVGTLLADGPLPEGFVVTLPKVTAVEQVDGFAEACRRLEAAYGLAEGRLRFEVQVETPQAVLAADGTATVARIVHAGAGRVCGLHFGTYDYSAALGVTAAQQSLDHPAADHAKAVMQLAAAQTGVRVCDGSTNVLPVGGRDHVHAAWRLHAGLVRRSLDRAYYQGWDLHPAQLVTRYLATYVFFREGLAEAAARLAAYVGRVEGGVLDEPATATALAGHVVRGVRCGAVDAAEAQRLTGLDAAALEAMALSRRPAGSPAGPPGGPPTGARAAAPEARAAAGGSAATG